jgi:hypothetical protein
LLLFDTKSKSFVPLGHTVLERSIGKDNILSELIFDKMCRSLISNPIEGS